jgi:hypothetical protein
MYVMGGCRVCNCGDFVDDPCVNENLAWFLPSYASEGSLLRIAHALLVALTFTAKYFSRTTQSYYGARYRRRDRLSLKTDGEQNTCTVFKSIDARRVRGYKKSWD